MKSIKLVAAIGIAMTVGYAPLKAAEAPESVAPYKRSVPAPLTEADFKKPVAPEGVQARRNVPPPLTAADFKKPVAPAGLQARSNVPTPLTAADFNRTARPVTPISALVRRRVPPPLSAADFLKRSAAVKQDPAK